MEIKRKGKGKLNLIKFGKHQRSKLKQANYTAAFPIV